MANYKEPVRLRQRKMPSGNISLYLDVYLDGRRSYEYLKLYLVPERTRADKEKNRETMLLADAIRSKRVVELRNGQYGFDTPRANKVRFFDFYSIFCEGKTNTNDHKQWGAWRNLLLLIEKYDARRNLTMADITPHWVQGFREYLDIKATAFDRETKASLKRLPLAENTKQRYFNMFCSLMKKAVLDGLLKDDPARGVERFKKVEGVRMYLTLDEVRLLAATDCPRPEVKKAFLFSCLTGLRRSDIEQLTWGDVHQHGEFTRIIFRQQKTKGQEYLDISPHAVVWMGERGKPSDLVFGNFHTRSHTNHVLAHWVEEAGINKKITFHCGRHTFATLMLDIGTDLYTVSKLLGHREIATTQIYAKILDKNKQAAVANIPQILVPILKEEEAK